jgi:hypothetical protein
MKTCLYSIVLCGGIIATARGAILLQDSFSYPDGVLTNVSGGAWRHAAGGTDQVDVQAGTVELTRSETEDVDAALGQSFPAASGGVIYARMSMRVLVPPAGANGNYFAHLDGGGARARLFVLTNGAPPGQFRLGISSGATSASGVWPIDLNTNEEYTVITRLTVSNATAALWVNAAVEDNSPVEALDAASAVTISRFTWRQDSGMGTLRVDDLVVATSFGEAWHGNEAPSLSSIADQQVVAGGSTVVNVIVGDAETNADDLDVSGEVSPPGALGLSFEGAGSNRTVTISMPESATEVSTVRLFVTDGVTTNSRIFQVTPVAPLLFVDDFGYADGPLLAGGAPWVHHSGSVTGQVTVAGGRVRLSSALTEDVSVLLPGGVVATNSGVTLYASLVLNFEQLPGSSGDYFAHFNTTGARGRLFANTANAAPGTFRLGIANGAAAPSEQAPIDLATNVNHRVVLRYDPAQARSKLWVNPASEQDFGVEATDSASPSAVGAFALRQDPAIGLIVVDSVRIGLTFDAVANAGASAPRLRVEPLAGAVRILWPATATGFVLQFTDDLGGTAWKQVGAEPFSNGMNHVVTNAGAPRRFFRLAR